MAVEFRMPKLGLTMEAGTIREWLAGDGDDVTGGRPVLLIETDKVETEVEASSSGRLHVTGEVGETYACGETIAWILAEGEAPPSGGDATAGAAPAAGGPEVASAADAATSRSAAAPGASAPSSDAPVTAAAGAGSSATTNGSGAAGVGAAEVRAGGADVANRAADGRLLASPYAKRMAADLGVELTRVVGTGPGGRITAADVEAADAAGDARSASAGTGAVGAAAPAAGGVTGGVTGDGAGVGAGVPATIAARQLADLVGVDLTQVAPSGADPRITRDDVAAHVRAALAELARLRAGGSGSSGAAPSSPPAGLTQTPTEVVPLTGMRGTIAQRMHASLAEMAQLTLFTDADMRAVVADRSARKAAGDEVVPGFTDYVIAAVAAALGEHPHVNSQITADGVAHLPDVHVGLAVALDGGLVVPVVRDTARRDLVELASETSRLATAARAGKLQLAEMEGGTFSVTALGMFGVDGFTPVINPPNTAILGVGRLRDEAEWTDDGIRRATKLTLSLTWDHRAFDGAPAAEFARSVVRHLAAVGA